jgi:hypothetical protein
MAELLAKQKLGIAVVGIGGARRTSRRRRHSDADRLRPVGPCEGPSAMSSATRAFAFGSIGLIDGAV